MKTGECRLCHQSKPLLKKSHIIPDFFYVQAGLYNEKHQIHKIEVKKYLIKQKVSFIPTGIYESGILCENCDNVLLAGLEAYGKRVLFGGLKENEEIICKNFRNPDDGLEFSLIENADYKKFKLFLLSILWRAAISSKDVFKDVNFPNESVEMLRQMLFGNDAKKSNDFPIIILSYLNDKSVPTDFIGQPIKSETTDRILITFLLAGFVFIFAIAPDYKNLESIKYLTPTPDNRFGIMHIPSGQGMDFILKFVGVDKM